jgi:predicted dinucleotide-binding enzyme
MGAKLGTIFARAGHEVVFSYARSNDKLNRLARDAQGNARAGSPAEAAKDADALLLAVHWSRVDDVLKRKTARWWTGWSTSVTSNTRPDIIP